MNITAFDEGRRLKEAAHLLFGFSLAQCHEHWSWELLPILIPEDGDVEDAIAHASWGNVNEAMNGDAVIQEVWSQESGHGAGSPDGDPI